MPVPQIRMRQIIQTRKNQRKHSQRENRRPCHFPRTIVVLQTLRAGSVLSTSLRYLFLFYPQHDNSPQHAYRRQKTGQQNSPYQPRIRLPEILHRLFRPHPKRHKLSPRQLPFQLRMRFHERSSQFPFLRHVRRLAKLRVSSSLFRSRNRMPPAARMLVKNVVVPQPQLERKIRPHRNKSMKRHIIPNRPRHTT